MQMPPVSTPPTAPNGPGFPTSHEVPLDRPAASIEDAARLMRVAQEVAELGAAHPSRVDQPLFLEGAIAAKDAAEMLLLAVPRSEHQELALASEHITRGYDLLVRAAHETTGIVGGVTTDTQVARYAREALLDFEMAQEILDEH